MKKILYLWIFLLVSINSIAQFTVSWPINGSVFQRSNSGSATIDVRGQANISSASILEYRIATLDKYGAQVSLGSYMSAGTINSSNRKIFNYQFSLSTGWYRMDIQTRSSTGSFVGSTSVKFGVGEVFIIAGQSNAQGFGDGAFGISTTTTNSTTSNENLDCVRSFKNVKAFSLYNGYTGFDDNVGLIEIPIFGSLTHDNTTTLNASTTNSSSWIGPNSLRTWYYQQLGNLIAKQLTPNKVTPVMFFNVAIAGTSLNNWERAQKRTKEIFGSSYSNNMNLNAATAINSTAFPNVTPWGFPGKDDLFTVLKNVLSFYGNAFGVRAVLWHQGEAETKTLLSQNSTTATPPGILAPYENQGMVPNPYDISDYNTKLKALIDESRIILPNLKWAIGLVSLTSERTQGSATNRHYNIINDLKPSTTESWLYSTPAISTSSSLSPGKQLLNSTKNVISQQKLVQSNNPSYVSFFNTSSDLYSYNLSNNNYRQADGTHFNGAGLYEMALNSFNNMTNPTTGVFTKAPNTPIAPPILTLTPEPGNQFKAVVSPPSGVSYIGYQWNSPFTTSYNPFNQSSSVTTPSTTSSVSVNGYVKDNIGRIHIIPYASFNNTGARMTNQETGSIVYPNPQKNYEDLKVSFDNEEEGNVEVSILTNTGLIIYQSPSQFYEIGTHTLELSADKVNNQLSTKEKYVFLHLKRGEKVEKKRIMLNN